MNGQVFWSGRVSLSSNSSAIKGALSGREMVGTLENVLGECSNLPCLICWGG